MVTSLISIGKENCNTSHTKGKAINTTGIEYFIQSKKVTVIPISESTPIVRGFLAPPMSVPKLPIEHPYATHNILILPKLLCLGTSFIAIKIDTIIGKNSAATPCSGITKDKSAQENIMPRVKIRGFFSK